MDPKHAPDPAEYEQVREAILKHLDPELVRDFSVEFGSYDDEPAMWVTLETVGPRPDISDRAARRARAERLWRVKNAVHDEIAARFRDRYPFFRFADSKAAVADLT